MGIKDNLTILHSLSDKDMKSLSRRSRMLTGNRDDAHDLLGDAYVVALKMGTKIRGTSTAGTLVNGIIGNVCMNQRRVTSGRRRIMGQLRDNIQARGGRRTPKRKTEL